MKTTSFKTIRDYHLLDADRLTDQLIRTDWDSILNQDIDQATIDFTDAILNAADNAIPTRTIRSRRNDKPWYTNELRREARKRDRYFRTALRQQTEESWTRWKHQRNKTTELNKYLKDKYRTNEVQKLLSSKNDPHKYHQILRQMTGKTKTQTLPPVIKPDGETIGCPRIIGTVYYGVPKEGKSNFIFRLYAAAWSTR